ncbi:calcium-activated chloride channel regulator 4 [Myotis lucifugus]|uniref:calcium-activated chloride channel regulator 4 n=1 Tax=Myotis lucifugus TaxID=59463 RepID=UPI0003C498A6|nr:calcium-activated chloride channel regulator 4 [Myotis lucifugus]
MVLFRSFVCLLVLYLLQGSDTSFVRLNNNGYEGIIIAINPGVPENEALIEKIKDMVTAASTYLFEATERRFFFKNVSILIPDTWKEKPQYKRPKHESYTHADVLVAPPTLPDRDEPYTKQFKPCEEKGEYIHFTPDVVLGKKQNEYGPTDRLLVHEWAHLRWGVFDEYNDDEPFYSASSKRIEATRCSTGITGVNRVYKCQGNSCVFNKCKIDPKTKLYEKNCQFFPDKDQTEKTSIMFMQGITSVVKFCNKQNHNEEAPSLQNKKCEFRSTWEVISNSEDFKNTTPMVESPPSPVFSLLRIRDRILCLVLDKSGSMGGYNRLNRMNQAAKYFLLQAVQNGTWVGMVHFDSTANIKSKLIQIISTNERNMLVNSLPTAASGGTSICAGIKAAFQEIFNAGKIEGNPPRPEINKDTQTNLESFTRTAIGSAFVVSNISTFPLPDLYPPSQITDLEATPDGDMINLTWTAPGDNFDVGKVKQYIIRISGSILDLRDKFDDALQVNTTDLLPNEANSKETFTFKPGNISEKNATHTFIAIRSVDNSNLRSKVSNIAQVALFIPQGDTDEIHPNPNPGISISSLVLLVVGCVVLVTIILSVTIYILKKKKNPNRPSTAF